MKILEDLGFSVSASSLKSSGCLSETAHQRMTDGRVSRFDLSTAEDIARGTCSNGRAPSGSAISRDLQSSLGRALADSVRTRLDQQSGVDSALESLKDLFPFFIELAKR